LILLSFNIISFYLITTVVKSPIGVIAAPYLFSIILPIPAAIIFCFYLRVLIGRYWDFRIATSGIFIMFLMAYLVIFIGRDLVFAHLIEPKMNTKIENVLLAATPVALKKSGATDKQIADKQKEIKAQFAVQDNVTVVQTIQSQLISVILIFVTSLIFGALFKKPAPGYNLIADGDPAA
ncbi:MAG: hypothetical protein JWP37_910, partial [Mucilaginibacter sp.]|nr:hypothetical protein [Mucilaginibacter sp.]